MIKLKQIITISKNEEITISDGKRELSNNIGRSYTWHYAELKDEAVETITSYNEFLERVPYYYREESKSKRDKNKFGERYSYFYTGTFPIKFSDTNFVSYEIRKRHYVQERYTMQDLMKNLPADEMIEYLKDNGLNVCPIVR